MRIKSLACTIAGLAIVHGTPVVSAADYPTRPIRVVVPFAAGGVSDVIARSAVDAMAKESQKTFVIENKAGADGLIGTDYVAKSEPDGHTILLASIAFATTPSQRNDITWNPTKDFTAVAALATVPVVFVTHPSLPGQTMGDFVKYARSVPGKINYGNLGTGSSATLNTELLKDAAGIDMNSIAYAKGLGVAMPDLLENRINAIFMPTTFLQHVKSGKLKALFIAAPERHPQIPDTPTAAEVGYPGIQVTSWFLFVAPAGTPADRVQYLNELAAKALARPEVVKRLVESGAVPMRKTSPQDLNAFIAEEVRRLAPVVKAAGLSWNEK
jgi:tripartite-type tricarboxylate transporter receptor subunit TctC